MEASVIIVNYNGKHFLSECLTSLFKLDFPKNQYEVIIVDNNSTDNSVDYVQRYFPEVIIVRTKKNLGFSGGNNLGAKYAKGKYLVFLNNDTRVDKKWLRALVDRISSNTKIATVNSKALLYYPFIELEIHSDIFARSEFTNSTNFQSVGILLEQIHLNDCSLQQLVRYRDGFYEKESGVIPSRWTNGKATILIPCDLRKKSVDFTLTIRSQKSPTRLKTQIEIRVGNISLMSDVLDSHEVKQYNISFPLEKHTSHFQYEVQNAGSIVFRNGYGRDRGAVVKEKEQFYELDGPFFHEAKEVGAFCGVSVIIRKSLFNIIGKFDDLFFMYYEDTDMSLTLRRMGYKLWFEPKSILYHIHSGSSKEWSPFFVYNVEKNHLAFLIKHFNVFTILCEIQRYVVGTCYYFFKLLISRVKEDWDAYDLWRTRCSIKYRVILWIIKIFPKLIAKRIVIDKQSIVSRKSLLRSLY